VVLTSMNLSGLFEQIFQSFCKVRAKRRPIFIIPWRGVPYLPGNPRTNGGSSLPLAASRDREAGGELCGCPLEGLPTPLVSSRLCQVMTSNRQQVLFPIGCNWTCEQYLLCKLYLISCHLKTQVDNMGCGNFFQCQSRRI
jgi:hypothetical protein